MAQPHIDSQAEAETDEISLLDILVTLAENLKLLVLAPLLCGLVALGVSFVIPPTYTATTRFLPPQQQQSAAASALQSLGALAGVAGAATGIKNPMDQYVSFLQSNAIRDALATRFKLPEHYDLKLKVEVREALQKAVKIAAGKDGLITLSVDDRDPQFAATLANAYVEQLSVLLSELAVTEASQRRVFFEKQLAKIKQDLITSETRLKSAGVNESALKQNPGSALAAVAQLKAQITAQEIKLGAMRTYLTENAPPFKQAMAELAALRNQLNTLKQADSERTADSSDYVGAYREFKYQETLFELMTKQYELAKIDESREGLLIQVVDKAEVPERKSKPKKALIAVMVTLVMFIILLLFVFVRSALHRPQSPTTAAQWARLRQLLRLGRG
ncbi:Wzz/FepE/Etk N-terminal domain-containing protein [Parvibium lacunae]|uniref:Lipopolysaccharide biosynthesis protein n=1 Tax=Parvibium lacunae TaxID=1888893 RepID=A0A368L1K2_9BURK|nr:Wzz/FepE/Etk N-terminal domain-containing protein [Parvibium lacunae]RCS57439.1 lipopolysaccharide biosynthesis protein [Parvibium lacunae]